MTDTPFKDFDAAVREVRKVPVEFTVSNERFVANMNLNAGDTLEWMEHGAELSSTPRLLQMVLKDDYDRLKKTMQDSPELDTDFLLELVTFLGEHLQMGGSGN